MPKTPQYEPASVVGVRELRDHLSSWLARVRAGEEIIVTERGTPVARIGPVHRREALDRLIAEGVVTPARRTRARVPATSRVRLRSGTVADLVDEQRR